MVTDWGFAFSASAASRADEMSAPPVSASVIGSPIISTSQRGSPILASFCGQLPKVKSPVAMSPAKATTPSTLSLTGSSSSPVSSLAAVSVSTLSTVRWKELPTTFHTGLALACPLLRPLTNCPLLPQSTMRHDCTTNSSHFCPAWRCEHTFLSSAML